MATPNIVNVATIDGFLVNGAVTTSDVDIVDVPAEYVYKINTVMVTNIDGTNTADVTLRLSTNNASTYFNIADAIPVPPKTVLTIIDKNNSIYMDETDLLRIVGSANSDLTYHVSGEKITD